MVSWEEIDLLRLSEGLKRDFAHDPPVGYLRGKTALRDRVANRLGCSELEAEELVDTLESRGFLRFDGDPTARSQVDSTWRIRLKRR